jgi:hypothetical protein
LRASGGEGGCSSHEHFLGLSRHVSLATTRQPPSRKSPVTSSPTTPPRRSRGFLGRMARRSPWFSRWSRGLTQRRYLPALGSACGCPAASRGGRGERPGAVKQTRIAPWILPAGTTGPAQGVVAGQESHGQEAGHTQLKGNRWPGWRLRGLGGGSRSRYPPDARSRPSSNRFTARSAICSAVIPSDPRSAISRSASRRWWPALR